MVLAQLLAKYGWGNSKIFASNSINNNEYNAYWVTSFSGDFWCLRVQFRCCSRRKIFASYTASFEPGTVVGTRKDETATWSMAFTLNNCSILPEFGLVMNLACSCINNQTLVFRWRTAAPPAVNIVRSRPQSILLVVFTMANDIESETVS